MKRCLAVFALACAPAYGFEPEPDIYKPLQAQICDPVTSLSIVNEPDCLFLGGSIHHAMVYTTADGWFPLSQSYLHLSGISQTDLGSAETHIRLRNDFTAHWLPLTAGQTIIERTDIDRAYAAINIDAATWTAGMREHGRKGSVANLSGRNIGWPFYIQGQASLLDPHVGGAVVQGSYSVDPNATFAVAAEQLNTAGTLISSASYRDDALSGHLTIASVNALSGRGELGAHAGFELDGGPFRAGGTGEILGQSWQGRIGAEFDFFDLTFRAIADAQHSPTTNFTAWGVGAGYRFADGARIDLSAQQSEQTTLTWAGPFLSRTGLWDVRVGLDLAENLEAFVRAGRYDLQHSFLPPSVFYWRAGLKYEVKDRLLASVEYEGNSLNAVRLRTDMKMEF